MTDKMQIIAYTQELTSGLRLEGASVDEVCRIWSITLDEYKQFQRDYPDFQRAHEIGERDYRIFMHGKFLENLNSPAILKLALAEHLGWSDKKQFDNATDEPITKVQIEVLRPEPRTRPAEIVDIDETKHNTD